MTMTNKSKMLLLALIGSVIVSFTVTATLVLGQAERRTPPTGVVIVDTLEAAESETGFKIHTPSHIPTGFERGKILISRIDTGDEDVVVLQTWNHEDDGGSFFIQESSNLAGFAGDTSEETLGGRQVKHNSIPSNDQRGFGLDSYFWSQDGKGIVLTLSDTLALDSDAKENIAQSIGVR